MSLNRILPVFLVLMGLAFYPVASLSQIQAKSGSYEVIERAEGCEKNISGPGVEFARWVSPGNCNTNKLLVNEKMVTYVDLIRQSIYFIIDKHNIDNDDRQRMNEVISEIQKSDGVRAVRLVGYADRFAGNKYNIELSRKRAQHALDYFHKQGYFKDDKVDFGYFGEERPVTSCPLDIPVAAQVACLQDDRRVDIEVEVYRRKVEKVTDTIIYDRNGNVVKTIPGQDFFEPEYKGPDGVTYEPMNK